VKKMLDTKGADIEIREPKWPHRVPLHIALELGDTVMIVTLLSRGASVASTDHNGQQALHAAIAYASTCNKVYENILESLIIHGACVKFREPTQGRIALQTAVLCSSTKVVQVLLDYGSDISAQDNAGHNSLHCAGWRRTGSKHVKNKVVQILLAHGSDRNRKMEALLTPMDDSDFDDSESNAGSDIVSLMPHAITDEPRCDLMCAALDMYIEQDKRVKRAEATHRQVAQRAKKTAVAMGHHPRLGKSSPLLQLAPDVLKMIIKLV